MLIKNTANITNTSAVSNSFLRIKPPLKTCLPSWSCGSTQYMKWHWGKQSPYYFISLISSKFSNCCLLPACLYSSSEVITQIKLHGKFIVSSTFYCLQFLLHPGDKCNERKQILRESTMFILTSVPEAANSIFTLILLEWQL